jgi:hypothetical protein
MLVDQGKKELTVFFNFILSDFISCTSFLIPEDKMKQQYHIVININLLYCLASNVALANLFEEFQIKSLHF